MTSIVRFWVIFVLSVVVGSTIPIVVMYAVSNSVNLLAGIVAAIPFAVLGGIVVGEILARLKY